MYGDKKEAGFDENNNFPTVKNGGGSIIIWLCVAATGTGNIAQVDERVHSRKYPQIL